jgi:hypothetical protein
MTTKGTKNDSCLFLDYIAKVNNDIIPVSDMFENFLNGIVLNTYDIDYIGVYEKDTKHAYFYIKGNNVKFCTIIHNAWHLFHKNHDQHDINVTMYDVYCGEYYQRNDYETNITYFYKILINNLVDKLSDIPLVIHD